MTRKPKFSKEHMLSAALRLMAEKGYYGVSIPDIAQEAGTATGTLYRYFESKEALVNEALIESKTRLMGQLLDGGSNAGSGPEALSGVWKALTEFAEHEPTRMRFIAEHYHGSYLSERSVQIVLEFEQRVGEVLDALAQTGAIREIEAELAIAMVFGSFYELFRRLGGVNDTNRQKYETLGREVFRLFER